MELLLKLPTMPPTVVLLTLTWIVSFRRNPSLMDGGNSRAWSGVVVILPRTRKDDYQVSRRSSEVWLTTMSMMSFIPRSWMAASSVSNRSIDPNVGPMSWYSLMS